MWESLFQPKAHLIQPTVAAVELDLDRGVRTILNPWDVQASNVNRNTSFSCALNLDEWLQIRDRYSVGSRVEVREALRIVGERDQGNDCSGDDVNARAARA